MKKLVPIFIIYLIISIAANLKAQMVTYSGPVEYSMEILKTAKGDGNDGGYNWNVSIDEKRILKGTFYATFTGMAGGFGGMNMFKLTSIDENIEFTNTVNNEGYDTKSMGKDMPASERTRKYSVVSDRVSPEKPVIKSGFLMFQNGKYRIMLSGEMEVSTASELLEKQTYPQNSPPVSQTQTNTLKLPVVISGEKKSDNLEYMEGTSTLNDEKSNDCRKCMDGNLAALVHGDMDCSYISKITASWTLVRRNKECDASVTYLKGDVKINGVPVKVGNVKVGAGDFITTGPKSRVQFSLKNVNETYMLGSKSKLHLTLDPCRANDIKPMSKGNAVFFIIAGKILGVTKKHSYNPRARTAWAGVRGQNKLIKPPHVFYASVNPNFVSYFNPQTDPEKEELINRCENLSDNLSAFYIDYQDDEVKDITAVKGSIKIEDGEHIKSKTITEGSTVNQWDDGTTMREVIISTAE